VTGEELTQRLRRRPEMCQTWIAARALEEDGGVIYLSSIANGPERVGMFHIYIWDRRAMRRPATVRLLAKDLMDEHKLDRLVGEVDVRNKLAIQLMKRSGANTIGVIRQKRDDNGVVRDVLLMDAIPGDFNGRL